MPVSTRTSQVARQPMQKSQRTQHAKPRQQHGTLKSNASHAQAAKRLQFAESVGQDVLANISDQNLRDILLVYDTKLRQQEKLVAQLTKTVDELKQQFFSRNQQAGNINRQVAVQSYAAVVGNPTSGIAPNVDGQRTSIRAADVNNHRHWEAQLRGYTREIRLLLRGGVLTNDQVQQLVRSEQSGQIIEGIQVKRVQEGKVIVISCKDERHRQSVFRQIRKNRRAGGVEVTVQCWLSALQRLNKQEIYNWANKVGKQSVLVYDWGDRVLLNRTSEGNNSPTNRFVFDLSTPLSKIQTQLYSQWTKWGLKLSDEGTSTASKRQRESAQPAVGEAVDTVMAAEGALTPTQTKRQASKRAGKKPVHPQPAREFLPGPPASTQGERQPPADEQGNEWHDMMELVEGDGEGPSGLPPPPREGE